MIFNNLISLPLTNQTFVVMVKKTVLSIVIALVAMVSAFGQDTVPNTNLSDPAQDGIVKHLHGIIPNREEVLKNGDGKQLVDYEILNSLLLSNLSKKNIEVIIPHLEEVAANEKRNDIKALLYYVEARVLTRFRERYHGQFLFKDNLYEENSSSTAPLSPNYNEWTYDQIRNKLNELVQLSLADKKDLLTKKLSDYEGIIKLDSLNMCPSLYHFLALEGYKLCNNDSVLSDLLDMCEPGSTFFFNVLIDTKWAPLHSLRLFGSECRPDVLRKYYEQYKDNEEAGALLVQLILGYCETYYYEDYIAQFPNSRFIPAIKYALEQTRNEWINWHPSADFGRDQMPELNTMGYTWFESPEPLKESDLSYTLQETTVTKDGDSYIVKGYIYGNDACEPLYNVLVGITSEFNKGVTTNRDGYFELKVPSLYTSLYTRCYGHEVYEFNPSLLPKKIILTVKDESLKNN